MQTVGDSEKAFCMKDEEIIGVRQTSGSNRVNRGGSWNNNARNCRVSNRNRNNPDNRNNNIGLRLVLPQLMTEMEWQKGKVINRRISGSLQLTSKPAYLHSVWVCSNNELSSRHYVCALMKASVSVEKLVVV